MRTPSSLALCTVLLLASAPEAWAARPRPAKPAAGASQLQAQVKRLTQERDELKERLASLDSLQEDLAAATKSRDLARAEAEGVRRELQQLRGSMGENQNATEALLKEQRKLQADLAAARAENAGLRKNLDEANAKLRGAVEEGALVPLAREISPARPMNLLRVTPTRRKVDRGVVVVNVLVSEKGEVLDARLLQALPGEGEWVQKANDACVEAAKLLVFDPARAADGKTPVRVWQGVGFFLD